MLLQRVQRKDPIYVFRNVERVLDLSLGFEAGKEQKNGAGHWISSPSFRNGKFAVADLSLHGVFTSKFPYPYTSPFPTIPTTQFNTGTSTVAQRLPISSRNGHFQHQHAGYTRQGISCWLSVWILVDSPPTAWYFLEQSIPISLMVRLQ